jgi:hypothetical protein
MSEMFAAFIGAEALPNCVFIEEIRSQSPGTRESKKEAGDLTSLRPSPGKIVLT